MKQTKTKQEIFWAGKFGTDYTKRCDNEQLYINNKKLFVEILGKYKKDIKSVIEFGSNIGINLSAIKSLIPKIEISAVEINPFAVKTLRNNFKNAQIYEQSMFEFKTDKKRDLVLTKGVLIHTNPDLLQKAYDIFYKTANKYICVVEYYNPVPMAIKYRGHSGKLFKRDFAGEIMEKYPDLKLINYGFKYRRDANYHDDVHWFLLKKIGK